MIDACRLISSNSSGIRFVARQRGSHANHLREANHRAEDYSHEVDPIGVQPVVSKPAQSVAQENRRRNNKADLGVASRGDEAIGLNRSVQIFRVLLFAHDEPILPYYAFILTLLVLHGKKTK